MPQHDAARLRSVAGYKVLRALARGSRATILVAHASEADTPPSAVSEGSRSAQRVVIKIFHATTPTASIDAEIAALCNSRSPHITRLVDLASLATGGAPAIVLQRISGPSLAEHLQRCGELTPGEAVTITAPLCSAVQRLHDAGITHGSLSPRRVLIDDAGAPVLIGFGRGKVRDADGGAGMDAEREHDGEWRRVVLEEQSCLLDLVFLVLDHVPPGRAHEPARRQQLTALLGRGPAEAFLPAVEKWLFELAPAEPLDLSTVTAGAASGIKAPSETPSRELIVADPRQAVGQAVAFDWGENASVPDHESASPESRLAGILRVLGVSSELVDRVGSLAAGANSWCELLRSRRRAVVLGLGVAIALATLLFVLLPAESPAQRAAPRESGVAATAVPPGNGGDEAVDAVVAADDPVAALAALAARRAACLEASALECLSSVDQRGSQAEKNDVRVTLGAGDGQDMHFDVYEAEDATLKERSGNSALVDARINGKPASFLLVKGEAGWRLREVFER